jgi:hypothetical protein
MATLKELFDGEFAHTLRNHSGVSFSMGRNAFQAIEKIYLSFDES